MFKKLYSTIVLLLILVLLISSKNASAYPFPEQLQPSSHQKPSFNNPVLPDGLSANDWGQIQDLTGQNSRTPPDSSSSIGDTNIPFFFKASNPDSYDNFGISLAVSGDTLVVGAPGEDSSALGVDGNQNDNSLDRSGAAYVFVRSGASWVQQAYLKASNPGAIDQFGISVAISGDTIVVGANQEDGNGLLGESDNSAADAGAAYVFTRSGSSWSQEAYLKASNADSGDNFGYSVAISGSTVVVGAYLEDSSATGVNGIETNNSAADSGAAYVFVPSGEDWVQQAYLKASNTDPTDWFGYQVAIDEDLVVVGAPWEDGDGIDRDQSDNSAWDAGAAYSFFRTGSTWSPRVYIKASNAEMNDLFGLSVAAAHWVIVVGASGEDSGAAGVDGDQNDNSAVESGAAYVFTYNSGTIYYPQVGYLKASNPETNDRFGWSVAIGYMSQILVSAFREDSSATGVNGDQSDNSAQDSGAAYTFYYQQETGFLQGAYLKASNTDAGDEFGYSVALPVEMMAGEPLPFVGARFEDGASAGVNGDDTNNDAIWAGAVYIPGPPQTEVYLPVVQKNGT